MARSTGKKRKAGAKRPVAGWIIMLSGVLLGLLLAVIGYFQGWVPKPVESSNQPVPGLEQTQAESTDVVEDVSDDLSTDKKKDYDFYTVLPEMEVVIPKEELHSLSDKEPLEYRYILQLGSFKNLTDAEKLKAKAAFTGQVAHIQSIEVNQVQWHRVRVGPFSSSRKADGVKRQLDKQNINALMLKERLSESESL